MTKDQLHTVGRALYGSQWQTELARNIVNLDGVPLDCRRVRQWAWCASCTCLAATRDKNSGTQKECKKLNK